MAKRKSAKAQTTICKIYETKQTVSVEISLTGLALLYCCAYAWPRFLSGDVMFFVLPFLVSFKYYEETV
jgi:hypothetical protein